MISFNLENYLATVTAGNVKYKSKAEDTSEN